MEALGIAALVVITVMTLAGLAYCFDWSKLPYSRRRADERELLALRHDFAALELELTRRVNLNGQLTTEKIEELERLLIQAKEERSRQLMAGRS